MEIKEMQMSDIEARSLEIEELIACCYILPKMEWSGRYKLFCLLC